MKQEDSQAKRMAFFDHLDELRARVMKMLYVFMAGFIGFYFIADRIMAVLRAPLFKVMPVDQQKLYFTSLFENFLTHLKIAAYSSLFFLAPYYLYQFWAFISPGLYPKERKLVWPFVAAGTFFFLSGAAFAYFVLFPVGFKYFITYGGPSDAPLLTIESYYHTVLKLLFLFGVAFELPVLVVFLGMLGIIDAEFLRKQRKNAIITITAVSAVVAPPDAISMIMLGVPLVLLYEASIWVVQWIGSRRKAAQALESSPVVGQST